jgi:hypothetical protein
MQYLVIVRPEAPDRYSAQAVGIPEVRAVAATEAEAVEQVRGSLTGWLASAKLVRVEVPGSGAGNPWLESFGRSAGDPDFDDFLQEVQRARLTDAAE